MNTPAETRDIANLAIRLCDGKAGDYNNAAILSAVACTIFNEKLREQYADADVLVTSKFIAEFGTYMLGRYRDPQSHRQPIAKEFHAFYAAYRVARRMTKQPSNPYPTT